MCRRTSRANNKFGNFCKSQETLYQTASWFRLECSDLPYIWNTPHCPRGYLIEWECVRPVNKRNNCKLLDEECWYQLHFRKAEPTRLRRWWWSLTGLPTGYLFLFHHMDDAFARSMATAISSSLTCFELGLFAANMFSEEQKKFMMWLNLLFYFYSINAVLTFFFLPFSSAK